MRLFTLTLAVAVVGLAGTATAAAQEINACAMKNGLLRVVDAGSDCGPQETAIALGQPQPAVETARVFDGDGREIGALVNQGLGIDLRVLLADLGVIALINTDGLAPRHALHGFPDLFFELADCEGPRYVGAGWSNTLFPDPLSDVWLIGSTDRYAAVRAASILKPNGTCEETSPDPRMRPIVGTVPVEAFDEDLGDVFSRPLPIWIGSPASASP